MKISKIFNGIYDLLKHNALSSVKAARVFFFALLWAKPALVLNCIHLYEEIALDSLMNVQAIAKTIVVSSLLLVLGCTAEEALGDYNRTVHLEVLCECSGEPVESYSVGYKFGLYAPSANDAFATEEEGRDGNTLHLYPGPPEWTNVSSSAGRFTLTDVYSGSITIFVRIGSTVTHSEISREAKLVQSVQAVVACE